MPLRKWSIRHWRAKAAPIDPAETLCQRTQPIKSHSYSFATCERISRPFTRMISRYSQLHTDILTPSDAQEQLLLDWILWQRGRGMSDKTITDRLTVIRRIP